MVFLELLAVGGNTNLGGEDIDYLIMSHIIIGFPKKNKIVISNY